MKKDKNEILKAFGDLLDVVEELRQNVRGIENKPTRVCDAIR